MAGGQAQREELYKGRSVRRLRADALETLKDLFFHFELHFPLENILNILSIWHVGKIKKNN